MRSSLALPAGQRRSPPVSDGVTVVLGWDGLDYELATRFDVAEAFGASHRPIETIDNPVLETPHTSELWPTIITGLPPADHGIRAATGNGGANWEHPLINTASSVAQHVLPERLRTWLGVRLRNQGASIQRTAPDYYADHGIKTIFDNRRARPIGIPNYAHPNDAACGILKDRGAALSDFVDTRVADDGSTTHSPAESPVAIEEKLTSAAAQKLGIVRAAIAREYDLVFVWLAYLDTVGHLAPAAETAGWQERAYHRAASMTTAIGEQLQPSDTLLTVSDHGLRDGYHTHDAFLGASDQAALNGAESVIDIADAIDRVTPAQEPMTEPAIREASRFAPATNDRDVTSVRGQLEDLGYI